MLVTLPLASCQGGGTIDITTQGDVLQFAIDRSWSDEDCIDGLSVRAADAPMGEYVWAITDIDGQTVCVDTVEYGAVPEGFQSEIAAQPLESGREYVVDTGGTGWIATRRFRFGR